MAGRKDEGMALLSVYADDDEEDADGEDANSSAAVSSDDEPVTPTASKERSAGAARERSSEIADCNREEFATSSGRYSGQVDLVADEPGDLPQLVEEAPGQNQLPGTSGQAEADVQDAREVGLGGVDAGGEAQILVDEAVDDFLPPPPQEKCSEALQTRFTRYLALKNSGRSFNEDLRNSKGYRNPDFLQRAVRYQEIDQIGSCFNKEVFDPHGYDPGDYYDAIYAEQKKHAARKQGQPIEFIRSTAVTVASVSAAGTRNNALAQLVARQKGLIAASAAAQSSVLGRRGFASVAPSTVPGASTDVDRASRRGGRNKKSKWDKVDHDTDARKNTPTAATAVKDAPHGMTFPKAFSPMIHAL